MNKNIGKSTLSLIMVKEIKKYIKNEVLMMNAKDDTLLFWLFEKENNGLGFEVLR